MKVNEKMNEKVTSRSPRVPVAPQTGSSPRAATSADDVVRAWSAERRSFHAHSFDVFCTPAVAQTPVSGGVPQPSAPPDLSSRVASPTPLLDPTWQRVPAVLSRFRVVDWQILNQQRAHYYAVEREPRRAQMKPLLARFVRQPSPDALYAMLVAQNEGLQSFGYPIAHVPHMQQTATLLQQAGASARLVAIGLVHDLAFVTDNAEHGELVADLLAPWLDDGEHFLLKHHALPQGDLCENYPGLDRTRRRVLEDSPYYEDTARFVYSFDSIANGDGLPMESLSTLRPYLAALFARAPEPAVLAAWRARWTERLSS